MRGIFRRRVGSSLDLMTAVAGTPSPTHFPRPESLQHPHDKHRSYQASIRVLVEITPISPLSPSLDPELGHGTQPSSITVYNRAPTPDPVNTAATLLTKRQSRSGQPVSSQSPPCIDEENQGQPSIDSPPNQPLPPQYLPPEASSSRPPPFASLYRDTPATRSEEHHPGSSPVPAGASPDVAHPAPSYNTLSHSAFAPHVLRQHQGTSEGPDLSAKQDPSETNKPPSKEEDLEPPPAYSEGPSPLQSFTFVMATAGGASSIITQVQQGGPPTSTLGGEHPMRRG